MENVFPFDLSASAKKRQRNPRNICNQQQNDKGYDNQRDNSFGDPLQVNICNSAGNIQVDTDRRCDKTDRKVDNHDRSEMYKIHPERLRHSLPVIYDAAHSFGVFRNGVSSACFGDAAMFSFHATKVFNTVEGGAVCCHSAEIRRRLCDLKNFGIHDEETVAYVGGNAKMNEFCAAMGLCNLRHLQEEIEKRRLVAQRYDERLGGVPGLQLNAHPAEIRPNYAYYPVVFDGFRLYRDEVFARLAENGIIPRKYFYPLTSAFACYAGKAGFDPAKTPVAAHVAERVLTLPMYADLPTETVDRICDLILQ